MKFGIGIPSSHQGVYLPTPFAGPDEMMRVTQLAERLGYYSAWGLDFMTLWDDPVPARKDWPEWHEILITLGFLAAGTSKIRLGSASLQLPVRDPFLVAKQAATLDVLSKGRVMLGVGLGLYRTEFLRVHPRLRKNHRATMFDEYLEAMHRLFTEDAVTYEGKFYACEDLALVPKPVQTPFPIYMTGVTDDIYPRLAKYATGWLLARAQAHQLDERLNQLDPHLAKFGRKRADIDLVVTKGLCLGKSREEAFDRFVNSVLTYRMDTVAAALKIPGPPPSQNKAQILEQNLIGTPEQVIEQVAEIQRRGVGHCVIYYNPVGTVDEMCDQLQWFGEAVLPKFVA